jgi:hypothetical protein
MACNGWGMSVAQADEDPTESLAIACGATWPPHQRGGAQQRDMMRHTRHKSAEIVRRYIREGELVLTARPRALRVSSLEKCASRTVVVLSALASH